MITTLILAMTLAVANAEAKDNHALGDKQQKTEQKATTLNSDESKQKQQKPKKTFAQKLMAPIKWIGKEWSAYDPRYSTPSFYNWAGQLQNTFSQENLSLSTESDIHMKMRSKMSSKIGPYFGYNWLFYGLTLDLNSFKGKNRRSEFTLSINSGLLNADIIRRRTGGDFTLDRLSIPMLNLETEDLEQYNILSNVNANDLGEYIFNDITGININIFTNHRKYSNPAAFSNGAIQLRSVGSPIVGFGYTHQKIRNNFSDLLTSIALYNFENFDKEPLNEIFANGELSDNETNEKIMDYLDTPEHREALIDNSNLNNLSLLFNQIPVVTRIDDWHLQLGYAYNIVFSRRLLLGLSGIVSPGIKRLKADNRNSFVYKMADRLVAFTNKAYNEYFQQLAPGIEEMEIFTTDNLQYDYKDTRVNLNLFGRAALVYNFNRWRAGINANVSHYYYSNGEGQKVNNTYGSATLYLGYCFGRKKEYRYNGKDRQAYITAALRKSDIEAMRDTMPKSNIANAKGQNVSLGNATFTDAIAKLDGKATQYKKDVFDINIFGCDLVQGPEGKYGEYRIEDGYVSEGQDTEGRLARGTVVDLNDDGSLVIHAGHRNNFRTGNWWKSQLSVRQTPDNWYPEMLHYALRGTLTCYLRGRIFGTRKPVKMELKNFYISHGMDSKQFFMIGEKNFESHSTHSIIGDVVINGRECRVYIESKKRGKHFNVYINRLQPSDSKWMSLLPDDRPISRISMPGTHDAGSCSLPESPIVANAHTQNFTVTEQLTDGIRCFDIRLKSNMKYGHTLTCRDGFDESMVGIQDFLRKNPSEFIIAMIGSDEGGKWSDEMKANFKALLKKYPRLFVENFTPTTRLGEVRGKILVIKRQEECPYGKLLKFEDNAVFNYDCFCVQDVYKEHKTYKKIKIVEKHLRDAFENEDPNKWYINFNSIAWGPQHHKPYYSAWGAVNVRRPMNKALREVIEMKDYNTFGMVFLDFYNDHSDAPHLVQSIIKSNFNLEDWEQQ